MCGKNHARRGIRHAGELSVRRDNLPSGPFNSGFHALLGRDAFTRFQAIPHYGYMKFNMPRPNGIITLASDPDIALRAENKTASLALEALSEALVAKELTTL